MVDVIMSVLLVEGLEPHHHVTLTPNQVRHGQSAVEEEQHVVVHSEIEYGAVKTQLKAEIRMDVGYTTNMKEQVKQAKLMMVHQ